MKISQVGDCFLSVGLEKPMGMPPYVAFNLNVGGIMTSGLFNGPATVAKAVVEMSGQISDNQFADAVLALAYMYPPQTQQGLTFVQQVLAGVGR